MTRLFRFVALIVVTGAIASVAACGAAQIEATSGLTPQEGFLAHLAAHCGKEFMGRAILAPDSDDTFRPSELRMRIDSCTADEVRIAFIVGGDDSRTWVLRLDDGDLVFTHEHLLEGDTLSSNSGWGGRAISGSGTELFQHFPDHRWDPERVPEERRSHWRLRYDPDNGQFVYYLDRGATPAYRLVFHTGQDLILRE